MAVNNMTIEQAGTILAGILSQAQGGVTVNTALNAADYITVGQTALKTGYDKLNTAISEVLSRSIFSARPYNRRFQGLERDAAEWGGHIRKINYTDETPEDDQAYSVADGYAVDMYTVRQPKVIQTNFYGMDTWQLVRTVYKKQLKIALQGPEEWAAFLAGLMQVTENELEQSREDFARLALANLIAGHYKLTASTNCVVNLITEYNSWSGESVTSSTVFSPTVFPDFARWMYGRIETDSKMLRERTMKYHFNYSAGNLMRHTEPADQRLYMLTGNMDQVSTNVLATTYNSDYLKMIPREDVAFWQNINFPDKIKLSNAAYAKADGTVQTAAVDISGVFGVLFDRDACGYTLQDQHYDVTPFNVAGEYWNHFWKETRRYYNDFTENCIIYMLA